MGGLENLRNKKALVLNGGGVLGIGEVGALVRLEELGLDFKKIQSVTGSSVGSVIATGIVCGATPEYMRETLEELDLQRFRDRDCILRSAGQMVCKYGLNKTNAIRDLASKVLSDTVGNPDISFGELFAKTGIHLTITYLSTNYKTTLYADHMTEYTGSVREAIVKSSSIPVFYEAYFEGKGENKHVICDGGTANNYPMNVPKKQGFDLDEILGLKLVPSEKMLSLENGGPGLPLHNYGPPRNVVDYLMRIVEVLRDQAMKVHVEEDDWKRSIKIDTANLSSTNFGLTDYEKAWLFNSGKDAVDKYLEDFEKYSL